MRPGQPAHLRLPAAQNGGQPKHVHRWEPYPASPTGRLQGPPPGTEMGVNSNMPTAENPTRPHLQRPPPGKKNGDQPTQTCPPQRTPPGLTYWPPTGASTRYWGVGHPKHVHHWEPHPAWLTGRIQGPPPGFEEGVNPNISTAENPTRPHLLAAYRGHHQVLRWRVNPDISTAESPIRLPLLAANWGHHQVLIGGLSRHVLQLRTPPGSLNCMAIYKGLYQVLKWVVNLNISTAENFTRLHLLAAYSGHYQVFEVGFNLNPTWLHRCLTTRYILGGSKTSPLLKAGPTHCMARPPTGATIRSWGWATQTIGARAVYEYSTCRLYTSCCCLVRCWPCLWVKQPPASTRKGSPPTLPSGPGTLRWSSTKSQKDTFLTF